MNFKFLLFFTIGLHTLPLICAEIKSEEYDLEKLNLNECAYYYDLQDPNSLEPEETLSPPHSSKTKNISHKNTKIEKLLLSHRKNDIVATLFGEYNTGKGWQTQNFLSLPGIKYIQIPRNKKTSTIFLVDNEKRSMQKIPTGKLHSFGKYDSKGYYYIDYKNLENYLKQQISQNAQSSSSVYLRKRILKKTLEQFAKTNTNKIVTN